MYAAYQLFFIVCTLATAILTWIVKKSESGAESAAKTPEFKAFQKNYLIVSRSRLAPPPHPRCHQRQPRSTSTQRERP